MINLVESGELRPTETDKEGVTALMLAADMGFSIETIDRLLELGCDINA